MFGISGGQKTVQSSTTNYTDTRGDSDNSVNNSTGTVTSGGGSLTNQAGAVVGGDGSTFNVSSIDPGSYAFASHVIDQASKQGAESFAAAGSIVSQVTDTIGKLAQGTTITDSSSWKSLLWPVLIVGAVLVAIFLFLRRRA